jgi:hypothetical protein
MSLTTRLALVLAMIPALWAPSASAQYNRQAGKNAPAAEAPRASEQADTSQRPTGGSVRVTPVQIARDPHGNAQGSQYDLAVDGAFEGQTILVIDYYNYDKLEAPRAAVRTKGFSMVRYSKEPSPRELETLLAKSNQFWLISSCDNKVHLSKEHHAVIRKFFESGHGVYLWGDNDPCNADADVLANHLLGARIQGDLPGDQIVKISTGPGKPGVVRDHLLTTGVEHVYEGVTVATVKPSKNQQLTPIIWGSAGNLVTAAFEQGGKRLLIDGGFTRLSNPKWDTAGTGRYIKNAAAWLANFERFGKQVATTKLAK